MSYTTEMNWAVKLQEYLKSKKTFWKSQKTWIYKLEEPTKYLGKLTQNDKMETYSRKSIRFQRKEKKNSQGLLAKRLNNIQGWKEFGHDHISQNDIRIKAIVEQRFQKILWKVTTMDLYPAKLSIKYQG